MRTETMCIELVPPLKEALNICFALSMRGHREKASSSGNVPLDTKSAGSSASRTVTNTFLFV